MIRETISMSISKCNPDELKPEDQALLQNALQATRQSYAPYSHFHVGAAVLMDNGTILTGSNQENEAYPSGLCAERVALFHAGHQFPDIPINALAITAFTNGHQVRMITPCGACRQVLYQYEQKQNAPIKIFLYGTDGVVVIESAKDLLPLAFKI